MSIVHSVQCKFITINLSIYCRQPKCYFKKCGRQGGGGGGKAMRTFADMGRGV